MHWHLSSHRAPCRLRPCTTHTSSGACTSSMSAHTPELQTLCHKRFQRGGQLTLHVIRHAYGRHMGAMPATVVTLLQHLSGACHV